MTEIELRAPAVPSACDMEAAISYAKALAVSGLLPDSYRGQPQNVLYAIEYGRTLGITPMAAMTGVHVIKGKPTASAALIGALVRRAGHKLRVRGDGRSAVAQIIRSDDPDYVFEVTFTLEDARQAELAGKDTWKQFPAAMLKSRAITQVARDACEEVLFGLHYTPEELGAEVDGNGDVVTVVPSQSPVLDALERKAQREQRSGPVVDEWTVTPQDEGISPADVAAQQDADAETVQDAEVVEDEPVPTVQPNRALKGRITMPMLRKINAMLRERLDVSGDQRHAWARQALGREITSLGDLTYDEGKWCIDELGKLLPRPMQVREAAPVYGAGELPGPAPASPGQLAADEVRDRELGRLHGLLSDAPSVDELARLRGEAETAASYGLLDEAQMRTLGDVGSARFADLKAATAVPA